MMKLLRTVVLVIFAAVSVIFVEYYLKNVRTEDKTYPIITVDSELIEVRPDVKDEVLLKGVTAYDEKDGDLTDKIIVESISKFIEPGVCKISYAVCDNDNHVASVTRKIKYKKYRSPRFTLFEPLIFGVGERVNLSAIVGATDSIDGDISNNVIVTSSDYKSGQVGIFHVDMKASNSKGDIVTLRAPMVVEEKVPSAPVIELEDNIVYTKLNKKLNLDKYVSEVLNADGNVINNPQIKIKSEIKYNEEGAYSVYYSCTDSQGRVGRTLLTVVVES